MYSISREDSACLFGKSSLCRRKFLDEFSCRRALGRDLFKEVSYLGMASQAASAISVSSATSDCSSPLPVYSLSPRVSSPSSVWLKRLWRYLAIKVGYSEATEEAGLTLDSLGDQSSLESARKACTELFCIVCTELFYLLCLPSYMYTLVF